MHSTAMACKRIVFFFRERRPDGTLPFMKADRDLFQGSDHSWSCVCFFFARGNDPFDKTVTRTRLPPQQFEDGGGEPKGCSADSGGFFLIREERDDWPHRQAKLVVVILDVRSPSGPTRVDTSGPMDHFAPQPPAANLARAETPWSSRKQESDDDVTATVKQVRSHLKNMHAREV
jgi:hypothetical protein